MTVMATWDTLDKESAANVPGENVIHHKKIMTL